MTDLLAAIVNEPNVVIIRKKKKLEITQTPRMGAWLNTEQCFRSTYTEFYASTENG